MTSTKPGAQAGGYRTEVDQQKLGPELVVTAGVSGGMVTNLRDTVDLKLSDVTAAELAQRPIE